MTSSMLARTAAIMHEAILLPRWQGSVRQAYLKSFSTFCPLMSHERLKFHENSGMSCPEKCSLPILGYLGLLLPIFFLEASLLKEFLVSRTRPMVCQWGAEPRLSGHWSINSFYSIILLFNHLFFDCLALYANPRLKGAS